MPHMLGHIFCCAAALTVGLLFAGGSLFGAAPYSLGRAT